MWNICGLEINEGEKLQTMVDIGMSAEPYLVPATFINGAKPGKTILITAQIHSMENIGTAACNKVSKMIDPKDVCGQIAIFHCVNISGFWKRAVRFVPEDLGNLNNVFPGDENGTLSQRIAAYFVKNVHPYVDFIMDLHSGAPGQPLQKLVFYPILHREEELPLVAKLDVTYALCARSKTGMYSYAANFMGKPGMILERGAGGFVQKQFIKEEIEDIIRVLDHYGVYDASIQGVSTAPIKKEYYYKMDDLCSPSEGIWYPAVELNQSFKEGDVLGTLEDWFGNVLETIYAPRDGVVCYYTESMGIKKGHMLVSYNFASDYEPELSK